MLMCQSGLASLLPTYLIYTVLQCLIKDFTPLMTGSQLTTLTCNVHIASTSHKGKTHYVAKQESV